MYYIHNYAEMNQLKNFKASDIDHLQIGSI